MGRHPAGRAVIACHLLSSLAIAYCCLSLPIVTCHCLSLPIIACHYLLLPVITCCCLSLVAITYCCLSLPIIACHCLLLPVIACHCLPSPVVVRCYPSSVSRPLSAQSVRALGPSHPSTAMSISRPCPGPSMPEHWREPRSKSPRTSFWALLRCKPQAVDRPHRSSVLRCSGLGHAVLGVTA